MNIKELEKLSDEELALVVIKGDFLSTELEILLAHAFLKVKRQRDTLAQAVINATDTLNNSPLNNSPNNF